MPKLYGPPWMFKLAEEGRLVDESEARRLRERSARVDEALTSAPPPFRPPAPSKVDEALAAPHPLGGFLSTDPSTRPTPRQPVEPAPRPAPQLPDLAAPAPKPLPVDRPPDSFFDAPGL